MCLLRRRNSRRDNGMFQLSRKGDKGAEMSIIYLDHAATTKPSESVLNAMRDVETKFFANPSSIHQAGREAAEIVHQARETVADFFNCKPNEIYFTSGGCESDNWAIKGIALANKKGKHIITSEIEHIAIKQSCESLKDLGYKTTYIPVNPDGIVDIQKLEESIKSDTILVSIMAVNNEVGTIQPIKEISQICKKHKVLFHTDAVQAVGVIDLNVEDLGVDLLSVSSHKFYGPKGVGILYIKDGVEIKSLISGSHLRSGTWNVPGIVGTAKALEIVKNNFYNKKQAVRYLRDYFIHKLVNDIPGVTLNGSLEHRAQGNINIRIDGVNAEALMMMLDNDGICVSMGSACNADSLEPSRVLMALGLSEEQAMSSIRITLGDDNTLAEIERVFTTIQKDVEEIRGMKK